MNVIVFTKQYYGDARVLKGSPTWNKCQRLETHFASQVTKDSTIMIIPDSLFNHLEPELGQTADACLIDEAINWFGPNQCVDHSECSGTRTCSPHGWCQGTSGCPEACEVDEAINKLGPNQCDSDIQCTGARTCMDGQC